MRNLCITAGLLSVFLAFSFARAADADQRSEASARIRVTATVIRPLGLMRISELEGRPDGGQVEDWLLRRPQAGDVSVHVAVDGETRSEFVTDGGFVALRSNDRPTDLFTAVLPAHRLFADLPARADSCVITVIYVGD